MASSDPHTLAFDNLQIETFDPHVCATLYNELVSRVTALPNYTFSSSEALLGSNDALLSHPLHPDEPITNHLTTQLVAFLRECTLFPTYAPDACLMPFVRPLDPKAFWTYDDWRRPDQNPTAICLFQEAPYMEEGGIFFDQNTSLASHIRFPWLESEDDGHDWIPLELILRKWVKMWDLGQIAPEYDGEDPADPGWSGFCKLGWNGQALCDINQTLTAWNALLDAIISRMPLDVFATSASDAGLGLLSRVSVYEDRSGLSQRFTFARDFLEQARRPPRLKSGKPFHIAPGLVVPSDQIIEPGLSVINSQIIFPVDANHVASRNGGGLHFRHESYPFMDEVAFYTASPGGRPMQKNLFQPWNTAGHYSHCPWNVMRRLKLADVVGIWTRCVEESRWTVGPAGVEGNIADLEVAGNSFARLAWKDVDV